MDGDKWIRQIVAAEIVQRREEGCDPSSLEEEFKHIDEGASGEELKALWFRLQKLRPNPDFSYEEPSALEEIREASTGSKFEPIEITNFDDKMLGAWLGRCAGCLLGKPVEGWSKGDIEEYLKKHDEYPLNDYFPAPGDEDKRPGSFGIRGSIEHMARDDDTDYTILGLHILETYGLGASSEQMASELLLRLPYMAVYTAERVAYRNLVNMLPIPRTATHMNPFREWIGAQIRADPWGYAFPGNPSRAAELAFRDARISHVKNGIYGSMMTTAMVSAAFSTDDIDEVIDSGLSVIPAKSRLHDAVEQLRGWGEEIDSWADCWTRVEENYGHYHPVHTINNALVVLLALLYGSGDFTKSICIAVIGGWDTDCNGATVGSIVGAMKGASAIPDRWITPLNDTIHSDVSGFHISRISDLSSRMSKVAHLPGSS
jgi:ADP-ribosylglycohydrolase